MELTNNNIQFTSSSLPYKEYQDGMCKVMEWVDGTEWFLNGERHREDGPAVDFKNIKCWYLNGKLHREDGPAVEFAIGNKQWWLNGIRFTELEWREEIFKINLSNILK